MILKIEDTKATKESAYLRDPYLEWTAGEGVPVIEDFGVDIGHAPTKPWARFGVDGAIVHLKGRGDFVSVFVLDMAPGAKVAPQRHLFEEVIYVLAGHGSTTIETGDGAKHSFEWGPKSLFALPLNARYQHFNGSGTAPARLASTNNMCVMMKLIRNPDFLFANDYGFADRAVSADYLTGGGEFIPAPRGRVMWETNFVPDMGAVELLDNPKRGKGSATLQFILGEGMMHAHESLMPVGTYKKAHRHGPDYHVLVVDGVGFSLFWYEGDKDFVRVDWSDGWMFAPPDQMFHQHFNTGPAPARYMATAIGNSRFPFTEANRNAKLGVDVSVKDGGGQIEFEDQDPRIHGMFLDALGANSVECRMKDFPVRAAE